MRYSWYIRTLAIVFCSVFLAASCDNKSHDDFIVGVSQCSDDLWRETANKEMQREASFDSDIRLEIRSAHDNSQDQIADIEYFISKQVDLLVVSPNESESLTPVVSRAFKSGIPVILLDRKIDSEDYSAYVGADNVQIGEQIGEYICDLARHEKKSDYYLIVLRGTQGSTADTERYEGLISSLMAVYDVNVTIIAEEYAEFTRKDAINTMTSILERIPSEQTVDAIVAFNDEMAIGAYEAISEFNPDFSKTNIIGIDALSGDNGGIHAIQEGIITASFIYPTGGDVVIDVAKRILCHNSFDRNYILNSAVVDAGNVRILSLQREEIEAKQAKTEEINQLLKDKTNDYSNQRKMTLAIFIFSILILVTVYFLFQSNRTKTHLNEELNKHNAKIIEQVQELEEQKNQLIDLSKQLEDATQAKLVFFTNVSHEFRTPLSLILGPVETLLKSDELSRENKRSLQVIKRNSNKLLSLINEILDFRTYENGKMKASYSQCNLISFLKEVNLLYMDISHQKHLTFKFLHDSEEFLALMDENKLEKIYFNLLSNAFKHVNDHGEIIVNLSHTNDVIELSVFNSGSYIPPDMRENIFLRFYKINQFDSNGSGIGLALSHAMVEALGGTITLESSEDTGTKFIVTLPYLTSSDMNPDFEYDYQFSKQKLSSSSPSSIVPTLQIEDSITNNGKTILVIEDNADMLEYIKTLLSDEYRILMALDGAEGIDKATQYIPDVIICDIMMPHMDGYEVCSQLKNNLKTKDIPIIFLTACALEDQRAKGYEVGADAYIQKPFSAIVLKSRIRNLTNKQESLSEESRYSWLVGKGKPIPSESSELLDKITKYIAEHLDENISVDELAKGMGTSRAKMYRTIKEITDYTPVDLINLIKLKKAIDMVVYQHKNLTEAAYESGFNSLSYFSRSFSKYYHTSPSIWLRDNYGANIQ